MLRVDADTHVDESDATWEYMSESERQFKPTTLDPPGGEAIVPDDPRAHRFWLIDGRLRLRRRRGDRRTGTTQATRELTDVVARIRHMDEMGVDVQVIYPTLLLGAVTARPEVEVAICRSYNRWLADVTAKANGRLRWVVVPPALSLADAVEEMRFGKEHGACGVYKRAIECGGKPVCDPYFFPLYEEAMRLDLPVCIHTGSGDPFTSPLSLFDESAGAFTRPVPGAFAALTVKGIPERFSTLRFGFIEAMASWIPAEIAHLVARSRYRTNHPFSLKEDLLRKSRFYVTYQTSDDLPYLLTYGTEDNLMVGTDYSHEDSSAVMDALNHVERLAEDGEIPFDVARKVLDDNPRVFYGL